MAASGQYTGWHSSVYPLKRSNSRPYFSSVPLLFRSQGITGIDQLVRWIEEVKKSRGDQV